jgi:hypothetical protein
VLPAPLAGTSLPRVLEGDLPGRAPQIAYQQVAPAPPGAVGGPQGSGGSSSTGANQMPVTVAQNASPTAINLGPVFGAMGSLQAEDGLQLSILGNTNSALVSTDLSETELTLTYTVGQSGTATITVGATDADGVSAREVLFVTVIPFGTQPPAST